MLEAFKVFPLIYEEITSANNRKNCFINRYCISSYLLQAILDVPPLKVSPVKSLLQKIHGPF